MASPAGIKHTAAAVLVTMTAALYGVWVACWLLGTSGAVPHQALGVVVWIMTIIMFGAPIVLSAIAIWLAAVMIRNRSTHTARNSLSLVFGAAGIVGFALMSLFALAGARLI